MDFARVINDFLIESPDPNYGLLMKTTFPMVFNRESNLTDKNLVRGRDFRVRIMNQFREEADLPMTSFIATLINISTYSLVEGGGYQMIDPLFFSVLTGNKPENAIKYYLKQYKVANVDIAIFYRK
jgi:hypothetical protein